MKLFTSSCLAAALTAILLVPVPGSAQAQAAPAKSKHTKEVTAPGSAKLLIGAPDREIADSRAKGLVWVNTDSKIYHSDGQFYGKTKEGKFMTEADAKKAGFRAAKDGAVGHVSKSKKKP